MANLVHDLDAGTHTLQIALSNTLPVATNTVLANITQIGTGTGYTTGGKDIVNTGTETSGTFTVGGTDQTWTATGSMGPLRYVVLYNDTPTSPADPLIGWWDYGSSITLASGETFTVDFGTAVFTIA